jgi:hypothetical protein
MDPRFIRAGRRIAAVALGTALVLGMSACGEEQVQPASSGSSSAAPGEGEARPVSDRYISSGDLPKGWRDSNPPGPGFKQLVCGVDIEPVEPVDGGAIRFAQSGLGPFLVEHVRIHEDVSTPAGVVRELRAALPGCTSYETKGNKPDSPTVRFTVEPLTVKGLPDNAVAWRQTATSGAGVTTDMVLVADDEALVAFVSHALQGPPEPDVLEAAVRALDRS